MLSDSEQSNFHPDSAQFLKCTGELKTIACKTENMSSLQSFHKIPSS